MCGFAGFLGGQWPEGEAGAIALLRRMNDTLIRRGPDSDGYWVDDETGIALGHRRLAIIDLSAAGAQPMESACARYMLAFNGEIYNHLQLREELERTGARPVFRGTSDTETLLAGFTRWGVRPTIERCVGMFAFALWDRHVRTLTLGRDRLGEKPVYYGWQGQGVQRVFLFGSELKALRVHPAFSADVPLGAFLTGGVDSSLIVALMQSQSSQPVKTFTIGYGESDYNEAVHAAAVARHLGTAHTELYVSPAQAMAVIGRLPAIYCEP